MDIRIKLTPSTIVSNNIASLRNKISSNYRNTTTTFSSIHGNALMNGTHVYVYSIEKHRPVIRQSPKTSPNSIRISNVESPGYAKAYVYKIPKIALEASGLKVVQGKRTWEFVNK